MNGLRQEKAVIDRFAMENIPDIMRGSGGTSGYGSYDSRLALEYSVRCICPWSTLFKIPSLTSFEVIKQ